MCVPDPDSYDPDCCDMDLDCIMACDRCEFLHNALWRKPLWNLELRILSKRSTSAPIFLYIICFRWKLDANNVWSVSFSFKYYLSTSWLYKEGIRVHTVKTTCERESDQANNFTKKLIPLTILPNLFYWQFKLLVWNQKLHSIPIWKETIRHILLPLHFENNESDIILGTSWMFAKNLSSKYLNSISPWGKNICLFQM